MKFLKILNTLAVIAIANVDANASNGNLNTYVSDILRYVRNLPLPTIVEVDGEDFSCSSSSIPDANNNSLVANASGSLHLNTSPINTSLNVEHLSNTNSENKNNDSVIANTSDTLHLSNSSIDISFNIETDYFDCYASEVEFEDDELVSEKKEIDEVVRCLSSQHKDIN